MNQYTDPQRALRLLDELQALGFGDSAFHVVHHFGEKEKIASFRHYCETRPREFREGANADVVRRLETTLRMYWGGALTAGSEELFVHLAMASVIEYPKAEN